MTVREGAGIMTTTPPGNQRVGQREKNRHERQQPFRKVLSQSMYTAPCWLNQRSCTWIIATSEPCLADIYILSYRIQFHSNSILWITARDVIRVDLKASKRCFSQIIFRSPAWLQLVFSGQLERGFKLVEGLYRSVKKAAVTG